MPRKSGKNRQNKQGDQAPQPRVMSLVPQPPNISPAILQRWQFLSMNTWQHLWLGLRGAIPDNSGIEGPQTSERALLDLHIGVLALPVARCAQWYCHELAKVVPDNIAHWDAQGFWLGEFEDLKVTFDNGPACCEVAIQLKLEIYQKPARLFRMFTWRMKPKATKTINLWADIVDKLEVARKDMRGEVIGQVIDHL